VRVPDQAGGAIAQQIGDLHRGEALGGNGQVDGKAVAQAVAATVEIEPRAVTAQIYQVDGTAAVDVRKPDALGSKSSGASK
jgi:hypothetical protein